MNNEYVYKTLYESAKQETKEANQAFLRYFDSQAKEDLGDLYFEYKDFIIVNELKEILSDLEKLDWDVYETPDNKARDISAIYRVLEYYMAHKDYKEFIEDRRIAKTKECN